MKKLSFCLILLLSSAYFIYGQVLPKLSVSNSTSFVSTELDNLSCHYIMLPIPFGFKGNYRLYVEDAILSCETLKNENDRLKKELSLLQDKLADKEVISEAVNRLSEAVLSIKSATPIIRVELMPFHFVGVTSAK